MNAHPDCPCALPPIITTGSVEPACDAPSPISLKSKSLDVALKRSITIFPVVAAIVCPQAATGTCRCRLVMPPLG